MNMQHHNWEQGKMTENGDILVVLPGFSDVGMTTCSLYTAFEVEKRPVELVTSFQSCEINCIFGNSATVDMAAGILPTDSPCAVGQCLKSRIARLHRLVTSENVRTIDKYNTKVAFARHIHSTMEVEKEELSEEETLSLVLNEMLPESGKATLVIRQYELMQQEYIQHQQPDSFELSTEEILRYHRKMFDDVPHFKDKSPGELRDGPVQVGKRLCPKYEIAKQSIGLLCEIVNKVMQAEIQASTDPIEKMLRLFALAAFTQFHFVDAHPFKDGNGRMCRFLSKRILDFCLPLPFPMYTSRQKYFDALVQGENECNPLHAHVPLLNLTVDAAIEFYTSLAGYKKVPIVMARSWPTLQVELTRQSIQLDSSDINRVEKEFEFLKVCDSVTVDTTSGKLQLIKTMEPTSNGAAEEVDEEVDIDSI